MKPLGMFAEELERELRIGGIVLGAAQCPGLTVLGQRRGVDGEQYEAIVLAKRVDDGALVELQRHGDGLCVEALAKRSGPRTDALGAVLEDRELSPDLRAGGL